MNKILIIPSSIKQANDIVCDGVIIGINKLSINMPVYFEIDDISKIKEKEIFISLNKNMHNKDLIYLQEILLKLNDFNIKGVIFYDIAIPNLHKKLKLRYDLVWHQEHMTNNYYTVNFWLERNVNYSYISSDITLREMIEIKENSKAKLMVNVFGYLPMFASKRHLIDNYLNTFDLNINKENMYMEKENKNYPVIDNSDGTIVYTDFILDGLEETRKLNYDYVVLNSFKIENNDFKKVVKIFKDGKSDELNKMFPNLKKGFFYEDTVYKVK